MRRRLPYRACPCECLGRSSRGVAPADQPGGIIGRRKCELPLRAIDGVDVDEDVGVATASSVARRRRRHLPRHAQAGDGQAERLQLLLVEHDEAEVADIASGATAQVCDDHFVGQHSRGHCVRSFPLRRQPVANPQRLRPRHPRLRRFAPAPAPCWPLWPPLPFSPPLPLPLPLPPGSAHAAEQRAPALQQAGRQEADDQHGRAGERDRSADSAVVVEIAWAIIPRYDVPATTPASAAW